MKLDAPEVERDALGVPVAWTLLKTGDNDFVQDGKPGTYTFSRADLETMLRYFEDKGELVPVDSRHFLFELAKQKKLEESAVLDLVPEGFAALGFGKLELDGDRLRFRVQKWNPTAYELLKEKIYRYFSPVIRGFKKPPLRITSVAMENEPAFNDLDAIAASANQPPETSGMSGNPDGKENMTKLEKALMRLTGRDAVALGADSGEEDRDAVACEVEQKASLIEQVKSLLGLEPDATLETVIAALKAETEKAKTADEKQVKLDELAASAEHDAHERLVARGRAERKIVEADMEYVNSLDSRALAAHLDHTAPKFPAPPAAGAAPQRQPETEDASALSAEDRDAIRRLRLDPEMFLKTKKERMLK